MIKSCTCEVKQSPVDCSERRARSNVDTT